MKPFLFFLIAMASFAYAWADDLNDLTTPIPGSKAYYGVNNFKIVLPGVLYRGGSSQGNAPLSISTQNSLCANHFSTAVYLYEKGWKHQSPALQCTNGELSYIMRRWDHPDEVHDVLEKLYKFINGGKGKMYIHCWHGLHASGYVAAVALKQFCGFSNAQAVNYWNSNVPLKLRYSKVQAMIRRFIPDPHLKLSAEKSAQICPKNI